MKAQVKLGLSFLSGLDREKMTYCHLKSYRHRFFFAFCGFEKFPFLEVKHAGNHIAWEHVDLVAEFQYISIVETARRLYLVFRIRKFALQLQKILIGFQIGV